MATKKFKNDVLFETLLNDVNERIPVIDQFGQLTISSITSAELSQLATLSSDYVVESQRGAANGFVPLDGNQKIASGYLPALAITDVYAVADLAARDALALSPVGAKVNISVQDGPLPTAGATITINGVTLTEGPDWASETNKDTTAANIANAINNEPLLYNDYIATANFNDVEIETTGAKSGEFGNGDPISVAGSGDRLYLQNTGYGGNDNLTADGASTFVGGSNGVQEGDVARVASGTDVAAAGNFVVTDFGNIATATTITVNGINLIESTDWTAASSDDDTAISLAAAIDGLADISAFASGNVVEVFATQPGSLSGSAGNSVDLASTDAVRVAPSGAFLTGGIDGVVNVGVASFIYDGSAWLLLNSEDTVSSVNGYTGFVSLSSDDITHTQANTANWTIDDGLTIGGHLDEAASRLEALESGGAGAVQSFESLSLDVSSDAFVSTGISFTTGTDYAAKVIIHVEADAGDEAFFIDIADTDPGVGGYVATVTSTGDDSTADFQITLAGDLQIRQIPNNTVNLRAQIIRVQ